MTDLFNGCKIIACTDYEWSIAADQNEDNYDVWLAAKRPFERQWYLAGLKSMWIHTKEVEYDFRYDMDGNICVVSVY